MQRRIDTDKLKSHKIQIPLEWVLESENIVKGCFEKFGDAIDAQPTITAEPVVHGHWIQKEFDCVCSNRGSVNGAFGMKYCFDCGAKMDEEQGCET